MVDLRIEEYNVGDIGTNCYFIVNADTKEMLVIDPGGDGKDLIRRINNSELKPVAVLLTHGHYDHAADADVVAKEYDIPIYAHEAERETLENPNLNLSPMFGRREIYHADKYVKDGDILNLAGFTIRVIHTPGHTVGGCCYYFDGNKVLAGTMAFAVLCLSRLLHGYNCKAKKPVIFTGEFFNNRFMQGAFLAGFVLLTVVLMVPVLHGFFAVQTLKMGELLTVYGLSGLSMLVIQGMK